MIEYTKYNLVGDDAETEETLAISFGRKMEELPSREAVKWARGILRDMKQNRTKNKADAAQINERRQYSFYTRQMSYFNIITILRNNLVLL